MLTKSNRIFVILGYLISLVTGLQTGGYQYIIISMRDEFALTNAGMALLGSVQSIVGLCMSFIFSRFIDRVDKRKLIFIGGGIYIVGSICNGFSNGPTMTIAALVIAGLGGNVMSSSLYPALISTDPQHSSKYTNMLQLFYGTGAMTAPMIMSVLIGDMQLNWRWHYRIITAAMLAMIVLSALVRPETSMRLIPKSAPGEKAQRQVNTEKIYKTAAFWLFFFSIGFYMSMETGLMNYARLYFETMGDSRSAGLAISVAWGLMLPTRFIASRLRRNKDKVVCICFTLAGVAMLLMAMFRIPVVSLIWCAIFGVFAGPCWPTILSMGMDTFPKQSGRAHSLIGIGSGLGAMFGNVAMGKVVDTTGVGNAFYLVASFAVAGVVTGFFAIKASRKKLQADKEAELQIESQQKA